MQYVIGPYSDELGNVLPQAVPGVGVPVDPLAFAGLLGKDFLIARSNILLPIIFVFYQFAVSRDC